MAPEQVRADECDGQSDLFSLGAVMYALAVGEPPFRADTLYGVMQRVVHDEPRRIRDRNAAIPGWLEAFIFRLLAKDRRQRFATAAEAAAILEAELFQLQHPGAVAAPRREWWPRPRRGRQVRRLLVAAVAGLLVAAAIVGGSPRYRRRPVPPATPAALPRSITDVRLAPPDDAAPLWFDDGFAETRVRLERLEQGVAGAAAIAARPDDWTRETRALGLRADRLAEPLFPPPPTHGPGVFPQEHSP